MLRGRQTFRALARSAQHVRHYNFASNKYAACFGNLDKPDSDRVRKDALAYLKSFDAQTWFTDPVVTVINGKKLDGGKHVETANAFQRKNGALIEATSEEVDQVIAHMHSFKPPKTDYRKEMRAIEKKLLTEYAGALVGNQALDFEKQDGITEIEESVEANTVERRLNDLLYEDEQKGIVTISRAPHITGCVSNFSNFLDLFRKTVRNLELGVPVVVFSRSNTTQHTYRWFQILAELMEKEGVPAGMLTHASCSVEDQRRIMASNPGSPMNFTGSRPIAAAIKEVCPRLNASTGGPNTMITTTWTDEIAAAARMSASIENSGQCTALRHLVAPTGIEAGAVEKMLGDIKHMDGPADALAAGEFSAVFKDRVFNLEPGYTKHSTLPAAFKLGNAFPEELDEMWRQVYLDVTAVDREKMNSPDFLSSMGSWLIKHQPISLAVNGNSFDEAFKLMRPLFERTGLVIYTVGSAEKPALTAQARPQDAEIFGEFPPRNEMKKYTKFAVVGPTPTPGYNAAYTPKYLVEQSEKAFTGNREFVQPLAEMVQSKETRGYLHVLAEYLDEAACGPRRAFGQRTALWGLQRPPMDGKPTMIRCTASTPVDNLAPVLLPFLLTNASDQVEVSVDPANKTVREALEKVGLAKVAAEDQTEFDERVKVQQPWNVLVPEACEHALVGHHVAVLFPLGHVKCTRSNDEDFIKVFSESPKWLRTK